MWLLCVNHKYTNNVFLTNKEYRDATVACLARVGTKPKQYITNVLLNAHYVKSPQPTKTYRIVRDVHVNIKTVVKIQL